jgi:hypothetical protein
MTYGRVLQNGLEDILVTRGMARIRRALVELAPDSRPINDDVAGHMRSMAVDPRRKQLMFTSASLIAILNSVVAGVFSALAATALVVLSIEVSAVTGAVIGAAVALLFRAWISSVAPSRGDT